MLKIGIFLGVMTCILSLEVNAMVLLTAFEPFSGADKNNSQVVAKGVMEKLGAKLPIHYCIIPTSYDIATDKIIECINQMTEQPKIVISLGEGKCSKVRLETRAKNFDDGVGPDNAGETRSDRVIHPDAPAALGLKINWAQAFCQLSPEHKKMTWASNDAGKFVCNNTSFNMSYLHSNIPFGFIHVPGHKCRRKKQKIKESIEIVSTLISQLASQDTLSFSSYAIDKQELQTQYNRSEDHCEKDFLRRLLTTY